MSLLPVMVIFGLSFPPVFFEILLALVVFFPAPADITTDWYL
jgi:hypothetical protein